MKNIISCLYDDYVISYPIIYVEKIFKYITDEHWYVEEDLEKSNKLGADIT